MCTRFIFVLFLLMQFAHIAESKDSTAPITESEKGIYYDHKWRGTGEFGASYGFTWKDTLIQYRRENVLGHYANHTNSYSYSIGYSNIDDSRIDVSYGNNIKRKGKYSADIIPVSLSIHRKVKSGFLSGKWGIGLTGYYYAGKIDMAPYDALYEGNGLGLNVVLPGELVVGSNAKGNQLFRLYFEFQIPLTQNIYSASHSYVRAIGHQGIYLGLSVGKYWE